jgi:hypothetical protein
MDATHDVDRLGRFVIEAKLSDIGASLPTLKRNVLDASLALWVLSAAS